MHYTAPPRSTNGRVPQEEGDFFAPRLGPDGEPCGACASPLAADQRYCLNCGERRAATRVPFPSPAAEPVAAAAPPPPAPRRQLPMPVWSGLAGVAAVSLGILAGVVLMNARDDDPVAVAATPTPAASAVATPPPAAATPAATVAAPLEFAPDWPAGTDGWTVQLQTLPKDGTTPEAIETAKNDAVTAGAADVGALDSDEYPSLGGGQYVVYSTVSTSKADAQSVLDGIKASFPDAKVVEVSQTLPEEEPQAPAETSDAELEKKEKTRTPEEAQKEMRNAPSETTTEGDELPPADDEAAGGGSEPTEF